MKTKSIKFTKNFLLDAVNPYTGNKSKFSVLANEVFEVEHVKSDKNNHVSIWLKNENIIIPNLFNDPYVFVILND